MGTPHLLTDVKFDERRKGYDPEQVDNFLERVSGAVAQLQDKLREATSRAEEADAKVADAKRAQQVAEAQVDKLKADLVRTQAMPAVSVETDAADPGVGAETVAEEATNVLLMAQKAADATAAEAKQQAMTTISDARAKAASIVAEAESQAERTMAEARRQSSELLDAQSAAVLEEARSLEDTRDRLIQDVDLLHGHFDAQRDQLRRHVEKLLQVLDAGAEEAATPPELSNASVAGLVSVALDDGEATESTQARSEAETEPEVEDDRVGEDRLGEDSRDSEAADAPIGDGDGDGDGDGEVEATDAAAPDPLPADQSSDGTDATEPESTETLKSTATLKPTETAESAGASGGPDIDLSAALQAPEPTRDLDLTTERLFGPSDSQDRSDELSDSGSKDKSSPELFASLSRGDAPKADEPVLGKPDARADEAMRAFFEADFDKPTTPETKARFGRRR